MFLRIFTALLLLTATLPRTAPAADADADSIWAVLEPIEVIGTTATSTVDPTAVTLDAIALAARDVRTAADLAPTLPATRIVLNSRGERQFMVRGASERHLRLWLDGIPLTLPWDERADASLVPLDAIGEVRGVRGVGSVLEGPNALAGTIELRPLSLGQDGQRTRVGGQLGEVAMRDVRLLHQRRQGAWEVLAAGSWRRQDGYPVPGDYTAPSNQSPSRTRLNSDAEEAALLVRVQHHGADGATWHVTLLGTDAEKGVPPETHLGGDARFWRYPALQRGVVGAGLHTPLGDDGRWRLALDGSVDLFHGEIRDYADSTYTTPLLLPGVDHEIDDDRTGFLRGRVTRELSDRHALSVQASSRYTRHRESLVINGPRLDYAQVLSEVAAEASLRPWSGWHVQLGAGYDLATTPESGDKPARDATGAAAVFARCECELARGVHAHASYARRSRFPALRELYSGALGRFIPNPELAPEVQDLWDVGVVTRRGAGELSLTGFASFLDGGIERVGLGDGTNRFRRVNLDEIRTLGVELVGAWRPHRQWELGAHHAILDARRRVDGAYVPGVEDRPNFLSYATVDWKGPAAMRVTLTTALLGPRQSADPADTQDGLRRLPTQGTLGVRVARAFSGGGLFTRGEVHLRVDNLLDAEVDAQMGLPLAGRTVSGGFTAWFDAWPAP